jgi:sulfur carrier protein
MRIELNGNVVELPDEASLAEAVAALGAADEPRGVAAAVGGEVVPRGRWQDHTLRAGDEVEVVRAVQGG